jgi:hypothetical protein
MALREQIKCGSRAGCEIALALQLNFVNTHTHTRMDGFLNTCPLV